jgi:hypothetical protein
MTATFPGLDLPDAGFLASEVALRQARRLLD